MKEYTEELRLWKQGKGIRVQVGHASETLSEKFERLVCRSSLNYYLSEESIKRITERFAQKSLTELHELVVALYSGQNQPCTSLRL